VEPHCGGVYEFRVLGPLEVTRAGESVALGGLRQRALLALLLLSANEVVPRERIVDALWGERPPSTAQNAIQVGVHGLRGALGRERLRTVGAGYVLDVGEEELDLRRFERLLEGARSAGDPRTAGAALARALDLWRGPALADLRDAPFAAAEAERLEELRLQALEGRLGAELELGAGAELVPELTKLVAEHPYREVLHGRLMLALYRAGRQAEALEAYARARRLLVEELGVEPSPDLQELERRILRQDASLAPARAVPATNLPTPPTPLVGRELELAAVTALLGREEVRLLTLTGSGGTGKTRLALAVAHDLVPAFRDGVWFVPLAPVADPALVEPTLAAALGLEESGADSLTGILREHLGVRRALVVLDNFEHVAAAAPLVAGLLAAAPGLKLLVTSRAPLRVSGEHDYPVPPLSLPVPGATDPLESEAVALFVERARAVRPEFSLDEHAEAVAETCVALDGLPLALELAAARTKVLTPEALRDRLERRLPLLERGPADLPQRQRTLRATIDWSHGLLDEEERLLFARLSVFAGGWSLEAAEAVCEADLDTLTSLVEQSLVRGRRDGRFAMLQTVREYALERLQGRGEADELRERHARHFLALAEAGDAGLTTVEAGVWRSRLDAEHDNLRAAVGWAGAAGAGELELRLVIALRRFWHTQGHVTEGRRWLEDAVARGGDVPPELRGRALTALAALMYDQADLDRARGLLEEALELFRAAGDEGRAARTLSELGGIAALEEDYEHASALFEQTIPYFRTAGDTRALLVTLGNLASVTDLAGDHARGRALGEETLALARETGDHDQVGITLHNLGRIALREGRHADARAQFGESIAIAQQLGYRGMIATCLEAFAELSIAEGEDDRAARLHGAAAALLEEQGGELGPEEGASRAAAAAELARRLGPEAFDLLTAEGAELPLEAAVALTRAS
jgi:predicted ATPase/DNA-binding SARP family transcriptional activator